MINNNNLFKGAVEQKKMMENREISAVQLTEEYLNRIQKINPILHAYLFINSDNALEKAKKIDQSIQNNEKPLSLQGISVAVHDAINMKGIPATFGSSILKDYIPKEDETIISLLKEAGAIILGKTNLSEFSLYPDTVNGFSSPCCNPWNPEFSPGGGNGGVPVAVASGQAALGVSTDYNGSLRLTSSFCGIPCLVPTKGMIPIDRKHQIPLSKKFFYRKGICARTIQDVSLLYSALARGDCIDPLQHKHIPKTEPKNPNKLKIAFSPTLDFIKIDPQVDSLISQAAKHFQEIGHEVEKVKVGLNSDVLVHFTDILAVDRYVMITRLLDEEKNATEKDLMDYTKLWLNRGDKVTGIQYSLAFTFISWLEQVINQLFTDYDLLITPASPIPPYRTNQIPVKSCDQELDHLLGVWSFTCPFNMTGHPVMTLPCGFSKDQIPMGVQVIGRKHSEEHLLQIASQYEKQYPWTFPT